MAQEATVDDFLMHYGVKGMKWGVRRRKSSSSSSSAEPRRAKSDDHNEAQALKKRRVSEMSNAELRKLNERMQLEQNYNQLMAKNKGTVGKGQAQAKKILELGKTGQEAYALFNSPAGKAAREAIMAAFNK